MNETKKFIATQVVLDTVRGSASVQRGGFFSVEFVKRTNGEVRTMTAKLSRTVKKGKTGEGLSFDPNDKGLVMVLDARKVRENKLDGAVGDDAIKGAFRSFPVDGVLSISLDGKKVAA